MPPTSPDRPSLFTPSQLSLYRDCPERYRLAKIERRRVEEPFSAPLARGKALHAVLADCLERVRRGDPRPDDLAARAAAALPHDGYPDRRAWAEDAAAVARQATHGLTHLPPGMRVLAVEAFHRWTYRGDALTPAFTLGARADAILAGTDADGRAYLEVVDWKTGAGRGVDLLQEVALRIVARHALGDAYAYIVNTTVFVAHGARSAVVREDAICRDVFREIKGLVTAIARDRLFPPRPSERCPFCPYFGDGCILDQPSPPGEDTTAAWLGEEAP
jgi:hypothetical protein